MISTAGITPINSVMRSAITIDLVSFCISFAPKSAFIGITSGRGVRTATERARVHSGNIRSRICGLAENYTRSSYVIGWTRQSRHCLNSFTQNGAAGGTGRPKRNIARPGRAGAITGEGGANLVPKKQCADKALRASMHQNAVSLYLAVIPYAFHL